MGRQISHSMYIRTIKNLKTKSKALIKKVQIKISHLITDRIHRWWQRTIALLDNLPTTKH